MENSVNLKTGSSIFVCPYCGKPIEYFLSRGEVQGLQDGGTGIKCKKCGQTFMVEKEDRKIRTFKVGTKTYLHGKEG